MRTDERPTATASTIAALELGDRSLSVQWSDGSTSTFHYLWLRDNCPALLHPSTKHRVVETSDIPDDVHPSEAHVDANGSLIVVWAHDAHRSNYTARWLLDHDYSNGARHRPLALRRWNANSIQASLPQASYPALCADDAKKAEFLHGFIAHGVGILRDVPCEPGTVLDVGRAFGELRTTSWGLVFDVISMENANSVAYTNLPLVTHTDEGYRDPAPTVQLQHFLRADAQGGESTLVDGFAIAEDMRIETPQHFVALANTMLDFHFADSTAEHHARSPIISLHPDGSIRAIRYSNHSALPFLIDPNTMESFYSAYREFGRRRESAKYQLRIHMGAGDLYMVDNHRVLHGRTGFASAGSRHLQSCYIERDELLSRLAVLQHELDRR
jgi:gamma-butyrobetaine dioxygenase